MKGKHNKVWKLYASRLMGVLSGSPRGTCMSGWGRLLPLFLNAAPRLPAPDWTRQGPSFSQSLLHYVPELSFFIFAVAPELWVLPVIVWVTLFSFLFLAWVVALQVRWSNRESSIRLNLLFHIGWRHFTHFKVSDQRGENMKLFTEFSHILK